MNTIVFITPSLKTGGGNRVFFELANCLAAEYKVVVLYPNNSCEGNTFRLNSAVRFTAIGAYSGNKAMKIKNIMALFDYVNKYFYQAKIIVSDPIMCLFINRLKDKKNVYRFIQADDYRIFDDRLLIKNRLFLTAYKFLCKRSYRGKNNFVFNSRFVYERFVNDAGRGDVAYRCVYPALNHAVFYNRNAAARENEFNICLVGRKHPWKGLATFQRAFNTLGKISEKITAVYIISHDDLSDFGLDGFVLIKPDSDEDIAEIYNRCKIFVSSSWWEGFGLPGLEAMACGCALITSDSGGCREYAVDRHNALYFPPKSEAALAEALVTLLNDQPLCAALAANGEETAQRFSWEQSAKVLENILFGEE